MTGESDRSQRNSPHPVVKKENNLSGNESSTTEKTEKNVKEPQGETDTERESNPHKPNEKNSTSSLDNKSPSKKKSAVIEPASVADYLAQPIDSSPQKGSQKVKNFKPIDHSLIEEQNDLVTHENDLENNQTSKENEVQKDYTITENNLLSDSSNVKCPYCGKRDDDGLKEPEPPVQCSEKQVYNLYHLTCDSKC